MLELIIGLCVIGALLIFVELFIPGMVAGACGAAALLGAVVLTYREFGAGTGNVMLACLLFGGVILFAWWMRAFPKTYFGRRWTLHEEVPPDPVAAKFDTLIGAAGKAITDLRPAGTALISERRVDVVAESELIEAGAVVRVIRVEGAKVLVRRSSTEG